MTNYREILRLRSLGINHSRIAEGMGIARQTVVTTLQRAAAQELDWAAAESLSDRELVARLFPPGGRKPVYRIPDYAAVHRELAKPGVTQQLLWMEYCDQCQSTGETPYQLTQFKTHYREYVTKTKATMHITRKPGEVLEVDWAGQPAHLVDTDTGEELDAPVFVAALPYSGYAYAEAFMRQDQAAWIAAHVNAYDHFGGVTRILVPDNLKTGVIKHTRNEVILNKSYQEMAEHYGTAILPARVRSPKDKATVEGSVGNISTFILAAIRNQKFFSLKELNEVIHERLHTFNHKPFQKKDGSRATWFAEERAFLLPLPRNAYELAEWRIATVAFNYHIGVDERYYSVPYEYIKRKVDVRLTRHVVEIFFEGSRVCSHIRLHGRRGEYSTVEEHMPPDHQQYLQWNGERFRKWAAKIGPNAACVVESILTRYKVEQQGYRACMALLKLSDQYSPQRLESACTMALDYTPQPSYKAIQTILKSGRDRISAESDTADRQLDKALITRLGACNFIDEHHNIIILGATGSGKTYLANAFGMAASRGFHTVRYIRLPELLAELAVARAEGTYRKVLRQYRMLKLLILDEWLLYPLKETEARDLLELTEGRYKKASTIFCSQFDVGGWHQKIGESTLADAICDRIVHDSYTIIIGGEDSMRKRKGLTEEP